MKRLLPVFILLAACSKDSSFQSKATTLANSTLVANGSLKLNVFNANIASLGIVNYRSSYELCGTSGSNLLWPVILPLSDSAVYPPNVLAEGDSLSAEVYLDTTFKANYTITLTVKENNVLVNNLTVFLKRALTRKFAFHNGSTYQFSAIVNN